MIDIPEGYEEYSTVMSNFDGKIDTEIAEVLKKENKYSQYAGWNFCGWIWWDKKTEEWYCKVMVYRSHRETVKAKTLEEIMEIVSSNYGRA